MSRAYTKILGSHSNSGTLGNENNNEGYSFHDPYWIIAVFPFKYTLTYNRKTLRRIDFTPEQAMELNPTVIITDDCVGLEIGNSKGSYIKTLSASLKVTDINYLSAFNAGDWVMAWIVNGKEKYLQTIEYIKKLDSKASLLDSGLKFVGRVSDLRLTVNQSPDGIRKMGVSLECHSFSEFSSSFFYNPNLASEDDARAVSHRIQTMLGLDKLYQDQFTKDNNAAFAIIGVIRLILGVGIPDVVKAELSNTGTPVVLDKMAGGGAGGSGSVAYAVPAAIANLLGVDTKSKTYCSYADLLEVQSGVAEYKNKSFNPSNFDSTIEGFYIKLKQPILGSYYFPPVFSDNSVWETIRRFLNPVVNEMFTSLRIGFGRLGKDEGQERLHLGVTIRQIPFTTDSYTSPPDAPSVPVTKYLDLPRWKIPRHIVTDISIGKSDTTRTNFVHVYSTAYQFANKDSIPKQLGSNRPIRDTMDELRNGLRTLASTVEASIDDNKSLKMPTTWMSLIADRSMNSHMTMNGTIVCFGIEEPVSEGQNVEIDGMVFHIEGISHRCAISPNGSKSWKTNLMLSNGMLDNPDRKVTAFPTYAGLSEKEVTFTTEIGGKVIENTIDTSGTTDNFLIDIRPKTLKA